MSRAMQKGLLLLGLGLMFVVIACCSGCQSAPPASGAQPVLAQCDAVCYEPCVKPDGDTGIRWDGSPVDPAMWDKLAAVNDDSGDAVVKALGLRLRQCEEHRKSCTKCLDSLEAHGRITQ